MKPSLQEHTFSEDLQMLASQFSEGPVRLVEVLTATRSRGIELLLVVICFPFLTPIPVPGFSTPFGIVVLLIGARLALGRHPWLPRRLLERELPSGLVTRILRSAGRIVGWMEFLLRPRLSFLHEQWLYRRVSGVLIMLSGLLLLLPLPIPLTNCLPALTVVLLAAGAMERDGVFFLAGCAAFGVTVAYFGLLAFGLGHLMEDLGRRLSGG
jgi:hypothetical protein